ncbi:MAG: hypothetical protein HDS03_03860 [Bacteroides sp.]|nr:hypothetical protein [Bacteroides sp.]
MVKNAAGSRCLVGMFIPPMASARALAIGVVIHILREASACLLVLPYRAMRRPQNVERATVWLSRIFIFMPLGEQRRSEILMIDEKLKSHFLSLYCMIVADGDVAICELDEMYRIAREYYGLTQEEINKAVLSGGSAFYIPETAEEKVRYLYDLALIAVADGLEEAEIVLLKNYAIKFGFLEENIDDLVDVLLEYAQRKASPEEVLALSE